MDNISGLVTVNGGTLVDIDKYLATVEVMGPGYSSHKDNMIAVYAKEGNVKVEVVYHRNSKSFMIYRFRSHSDTQHYWSARRSYDWMMNSPKYGNLAKTCVGAYAQIFKGM